MHQDLALSSCMRLRGGNVAMTTESSAPAATDAQAKKQEAIISPNRLLVREATRFKDCISGFEGDPFEVSSDYPLRPRRSLTMDQVFLKPYFFENYRPVHVGEVFPVHNQELDMTVDFKVDFSSAWARRGNAAV
eukprot:746529-Hanusia_phi.AAC.6